MRRLGGLSAAVAAINVIATIALFSASESSRSSEVRLGMGGDVNLGTRNNPVLKPLREEERSSQHRHSQGRLHTLVFHAGQNSRTLLPVNPGDFQGARVGNIGDAQKAWLRI